MKYMSHERHARLMMMMPELNIICTAEDQFKRSQIFSDLKKLHFTPERSRLSVEGRGNIPALCKMWANYLLETYFRPESLNN
jgi:hypothetical protein